MKFLDYPQMRLKLYKINPTCKLLELVNDYISLKTYFIGT